VTTIGLITLGFLVIEMNDDMFVSAVSPSGKLAGVFEYDGDVGYFYLLNLERPKGQQITGSIIIASEDPEFVESDVRISWSSDDAGAGLFIRDHLWAVFMGPDKKYGGNYEIGRLPDIPKAVTSLFVRA